MWESLKPIAECGVVGLALAVIFYWLTVLFGRITGDRASFKWWLKFIIPQGIVVAVALKMMGWL